jgi:hypothetical protein
VRRALPVRTTTRLSFELTFLASPLD